MGLDQLHDGVWAQVLLPKLVADRSAAAVALTCSKLRSLCQRLTQHLDLTQLANSSNDVQLQAHSDTLPQRFTACWSVSLRLDDDRSSHAVTSHVVPALARLPALGKLKLMVRQTALNTPDMAALLSTTRQQLTQVRSLSLQLHQTWADASLAWQQLCSTTQLTCLHVTFDGGVKDSIQLQDMAALGALRNLQHLAVGQLQLQLPAAGGNPPQQEATVPPNMEFLGQLTALTFLLLSVWTPDGLDSIQACSKLQALKLVSAGPLVELGPAVWRAVGSLTALTELYISKSHRGTTTEACYAALAQLTQLQQALLGVWTPAALPALADLQQLHEVKGCWQNEELLEDYSSITCPHITKLESWRGSPPFKAFPRLLVFSQGGLMTADSLAALGQHCKQLQMIDTQVPNSPNLIWGSLPRPTPAVERVGAISSLSHLTALEAVSFHPRDDAELVALSLALPGMHHLKVLVPRHNQVTHSGLLQLGALKHLEAVTLGLWWVTLTQNAAQMLLCSLGHVESLRVYVSSSEVAAVVHAAAEWVRSTGLRLPRMLRVHVLEG